MAARTFRRRAGNDGPVAGQRKEQAQLFKNGPTGHSIFEAKIFVVGLDDPLENTVSDCFSIKG